MKTKKIILSIVLGLFLILGNSYYILAEENVMPLGEVLCDVYGSQHHFYYKGNPRVVDRETGETLVLLTSGWSLYKCNCGICIASSGIPHTGQEIGYYYEVMGNYCISFNNGYFEVRTTAKQRRYSNKSSIKDLGYYFYN